MDNDELRTDYDLRSINKVVSKGTDIDLFVTSRYIHHYCDCEYEKHTIKLLKNYLKPDSVFVDVGAHFGYYSLVASKYGHNVGIIAFEPDKFNYSILNRNLAHNNARVVELRNEVVSDLEGEINFYTTEASDSCGVYGHPRVRTKEINKKRAVTLDSVLANVANLDIIKIDVEGHEINVLEGMRHVIYANPKLKLIVEFNPKCQINAGYEPEEILEKLGEYGFENYIINEDTEKVYRITNNTCKWDEFLSKHEYKNLLCINKKRSLFVAYFSHTSDLYGAELSMVSLIDQMRNEDVLAHCILPTDNGQMNSKIKNIGVSTDIVPYCWWANNNHIDDTEYKKSFSEIVSYSRELERINPHLICTNTAVIPWGGISSILVGKPHLWNIREFVEKDHGLLFQTSFEEAAQAIDLLSDRVVYNSLAVQREYEKYIHKNKGETLDTTINIPESLLLEKVPRIFCDGVLKLIVVGRLSESKGQIQAVNAVIELIKKGNKVELLLLGAFNPADSYYLAIQNKINTSGTQCIHMINHVHNPYPYIIQADILLMCSKMEALGRVTIEAMLLGKPVIGSNAGGTAELIEDKKSGLLYDSDENDSLIEKVEYFIEHPEKINEFGTYARTMASKKYSGNRYGLRMREKMMSMINEWVPTLIKSRRLVNYIFRSLSIPISDVQMIEYVSKMENTIHETRNVIAENLELHTSIRLLGYEIAGKRALLKQLQSSKFYRAWQLYNSLIRIFR